ncbi:carbon-nitrogen hydrolase family protein [Tenggerimyces flavus]|uniref:Carbon-nitrogen hydrolase family protein n=1 Tax=Tenggerimyces flavus TaxID=1708749 RepID=A0ABV7YJX7_9ACTN|nr:carbon-nitrogen hydrolase family protein [Tenggerimyces flavus]MBM7784575.1 putative amidohydrolase [Tenggerimyces flavus]
MRAVVVQFAAGLDKSENLETIQRLARDSASVHPDLVVLPEAAMHDFGRQDLPLAPVAERLDGPFVDTLSRLAKELGSTVVGGMFEAVPDDPDLVYNTLVALGPDGELAGAYRKIHLYDAFGYQESARLAPGSGELVTLAVGEHRVGLLTCYDLRFPELTRKLAGDGADVLAIAAAWLAGPLKEDHWTTLVRARAIENTSYVLASAQCGRAYCGRSMVVDPTGTAVSALAAEPGWTSADVSAERVQSVRLINPTLAHRRFGIEGGDAP